MSEKNFCRHCEMPIGPEREYCNECATMYDIKNPLTDSYKYHSLRLAVLEFYNSPTSGKRHDLALSAGIEFVNGTWILKEGE